MTTIPNLPTDNLYKFIALSGVLIVLVSLYALVTKVADLEMRTIDLQQADALVSRTTKRRTEKIADVRKTVSEYEERAASGNVEIEELEALQSLLDENLKALEVEGVDLIKHGTEVDRMSLLIKHTKEMLWFSVVAVILGHIFAVIGFSLWYTRVQQPLDALLRNQLHSDNL